MAKMIPLLVFLSALAFSNAIPILSQGQELVYNYNARIRVGVFEPASFASQFNLDGKLHIQRESQNSILLRFSDLTFRLYNGELNLQRERESQALPLPQETAELLRVFRIEYEDGKLKQLSVEAGEPEYIVNIKRAIASQLQLDLKNLQLDNEVPSRRAFITEEPSIYGLGLEEYNVEFQGNQILVQKMRDVKSSRNWYAYSGLNVEPITTSGLRNSPVSVTSHRLITLVKNQNGGVDIQRLDAHGGIYLHLLRGAVEAQYVSVNQTLNLSERLSIETPLRLNNEQRVQQLEFRLDSVTDSGALVAFGRNGANQEDLVRRIQQALSDVLSYLETNQLTLEAPDVRKSQSVNRLHHLMGVLELTTMEQLYVRLEENQGIRERQMLRIFQQILPQVGTRASVILIRNLVQKNQLDEDLIVDLLSKMPLNLRMPSEKLLQEVEILADLGSEFSLNIRRAGVLSFASLVHKVFAHRTHQRNQHLGRIQLQENLINPDGNLRRNEEITRSEQERRDNLSREQNNLLNQYIRKFLSRVENAQDYPTQLLNMQALYNIQIGVNRQLERLVRGEGVNRHVQFLAICASMAEDVKDPERVFQIYWPIFTNRQLHLELRAGSLYILMSTQVTMNRLWNIYWFLQTEQNPELYNFMYTTLQSLAQSKNPILRDLRINSAQILRYMRRPLRKYLTANHIFDYEDPRYEFGAMIQAMTISTRTSKSLYIDVTNNIMDVPLQLYSLYLKIDGIDQEVIDRLPKERIVRMNIPELEELGKIILSLPDLRNIHIEYSILQNNQVIRIGFIDQSNVRDLVNCIQNFQIENLKLLKSSLDIQYNVLSQLIMLNDLGIPTILQIKSPRITNNVINIVREVANKITNIQGDIRLQTSVQSSIDVGIYNPIADIWQGVQRTNIYDQVIPLNLNLIMNVPQNSIKLTLNLNEDQQRGVIGLRNHVRNIVYVRGDEVNNYLRQSSSQSNVLEEITRGRRNRNVVSLLNVECENTGLRYEVSVFDNERQISRRNLVDLLSLVGRPENKNDQGSPLIGLLLSARNVWSRIFMYPGVGTSGILIRAVPSTINRVSQIDLSLRLNQEINREENPQAPNMKLNSRATYSLKQQDRVLRTWDINANIEMNAGHTINNLKLQISRIIPDQKDYRICIDGIKKWVQNGVTGHLSIAAGQTSDNKCVKDEILIDVNMRGEVPQEQLNAVDNQRIIDECANTHTYDPLGRMQQTNYIPINCIQRQTAIRRYEYDVKTTRVPQQITESLETLIRILKELVRLNISQAQGDRLVQMEENNLRVVVNYALNGNELDLVIMRPKETLRISGVQVPGINVGLLPDNYHFSRRFLLLQRLGLINSCIISQQSILNSQDVVIDQQNISENVNDWIVYLRDRNNLQNFNVAIRKIVEQQNQLGLRIISRDQTLEIQPYGDQWQVILNGQPLSIDRTTYRLESWFTIGVLSDQDRSLILQIPSQGLFIQYNGQIIALELAKSVTSLEGKCLDG